MSDDGLDAEPRADLAAIERSAFQLRAFLKTYLDAAPIDVRRRLERDARVLAVEISLDAFALVEITPGGGARKVVDTLNFPETTP